MCVQSYGMGNESSGEPMISGDLKINIKGKHLILARLEIPTKFRRFYLVLFCLTGGRYVSKTKLQLMREVADKVDTHLELAPALGGELRMHLRSHGIRDPS
ncbi:uncharacterized protein LOC109725654 [Ananas comosus]|uniref:Uncharacterized protein LOC109725654 n=1 Tax=Ananas comosus TaxID=4615 RepID=A0A6P5GXI2_ANACO|nr:uncharacterized protein LOC109725654 [Ananas comosus]